VGVVTVFALVLVAVCAVLYLAASLFRGVLPEEPPLDSTAFLHLEDRCDRP
jgi:hypothetical protein